ncbi:hypothetical protein V6Z12_D12G134700 [Gossypium hirsutum]
MGYWVTLIRCRFSNQINPIQTLIKTLFPFSATAAARTTFPPSLLLTETSSLFNSDSDETQQGHRQRATTRRTCWSAGQRVRCARATWGRSGCCDAKARKKAAAEDSRVSKFFSFGLIWIVG